MKGWVYIITNEAMPGLVKVGYTTTSPKQRASELYNTGCPSKYDVEYAIEVDDCELLEKKMHHHLKKFNIGKEWFKIDKLEAIHELLYINKGKIFRAIKNNIEDGEIKEKIKKEKRQKRIDKNREYLIKGTNDIYNDFIQKKETEYKDILNKEFKPKKLFFLFNNDTATEEMYNSEEYKQRVTFFNEKIKNIKKQKNDILNILHNNNNVLYICDSCKNRFEIPILDYIINATCPKCNTTKKIIPIELLWNSILELVGLDKKNIKLPYPVYRNSGYKKYYERKNKRNNYAETEKIFIDDEFYPSGEGENVNNRI